MKFYTDEKDAVLQEVASTERGLAAAEAEKRLEANGKNKLKAAKKDSLIKRFFMQMADPMILILLAAAAISAVTSVYEGEAPTDVFIILFVVIVNAVLGVYQESKAEKAIEALQEMSAATSKVLRDDEIFEAGDAVPADMARLIAGMLETDPVRRYSLDTVVRLLSGEDIRPEQQAENREATQNDREAALRINIYKSTKGAEKFKQAGSLF